jgi:hypothetical protein
MTLRWLLLLAAAALLAVGIALTEEFRACRYPGSL